MIILNIVLFLIIVGIILYSNRSFLIWLDDIVVKIHKFLEERISECNKRP